MLTDAQLESILQFPDYGDIERLVRELRFYRKGYELARDALDFLFETDNTDSDYKIPPTTRASMEPEAQRVLEILETVIRNEVKSWEKPAINDNKSVVTSSKKRAD